MQYGGTVRAPSTPASAAIPALAAAANWGSRVEGAAHPAAAGGRGRAPARIRGSTAATPGPAAPAPGERRGYGALPPRTYTGAVHGQDTDAAASGSTLEASLLEWRRRALDVVLVAGLVLGAGPLALTFWFGGDPLPLGLRLTAVAVFGLVVVLAVARSASLALRTWGFVAALLTLAAVMLAARGLESGGRLVLMVVPLLASVLLGSRGGYAAAAISLALYAAATLLVAGGHWVPAASGEADPAALWVLQGALLVVVTVPVMVLVNQFVDRLRRALVVEQEAKDRLVQAEQERRTLERALLETGERERRAVGHQLHDGPCQQITAALLRCKVAHNALVARGSPAEAAHLQAIGELLDASVAEIHDLARGLSPAALSPGAHAAALGDLAQRVRAGGTMGCELVHTGDAAPEDLEVTSQLFRIALEAVANAARHARARRIRIELGRDREGTRLAVSDDGIGIGADSAPEGMGLRIMRHRAEVIGGSLSVGPAPGGGTLVTCTVPRPRPAPGSEARG